MSWHSFWVIVESMLRITDDKDEQLIAWWEGNGAFLIFRH